MRRLFMAKNERIIESLEKYGYHQKEVAGSYRATLLNDKSFNKQDKYRIARLKTRLAKPPKVRDSSISPRSCLSRTPSIDSRCRNLDPCPVNEAQVTVRSDSSLSNGRPNASPFKVLLRKPLLSMMSIRCAILLTP